MGQYCSIVHVKHKGKGVVHVEHGGKSVLLNPHKGRGDLCLELMDAGNPHDDPQIRGDEELTPQGRKDGLHKGGRPAWTSCCSRSTCQDPFKDALSWL